MSSLWKDLRKASLVVPSEALSIHERTYRRATLITSDVEYPTITKTLDDCTNKLKDISMGFVEQERQTNKRHMAAVTDGSFLIAEIVWNIGDQPQLSVAILINE